MFRRLLALAVIIALGLLSRLHPIGWSLYDKSLGDVLYAVAAYLGLSLVLFRQSPTLISPLALTWCLGVEFFQATGIPAQYASNLLVRWLIGTDFAWHDIFCYIVGIAVITLLDVTLLRTRQIRNRQGAALHHSAAH